MSSSQINEFQSAASTSVLSDRILTAVAEKENTSPLEFDRLLAEAIDPDALDNLFQEGTQGSITFSYLGYRITADADGHVDVTDESE